MNYPLLSDFLWYMGHVLCGCSVLFTHNNYYIAVSMVICGQFITIISRPIGRIKHTTFIEEPIPKNTEITIFL